jgi:hypothetical protein
MPVTFVRTPQSHQGLLGVFVLEQLQTFSELSQSIEYRVLGYVRFKSEVHWIFRFLNRNETSLLDGLLGWGLLAVRPVLTRNPSDLAQLTHFGFS